MSEYCPDCGPATIAHGIERWINTIDYLLSPVARLMRPLSRGVLKILKYLRAENYASILFRILAAFRLGTITHALDTEDSLRTRALWESATDHGIKLFQFRLFGRPQTSVFIAEWRGQKIVFDGLPRPGNASRALAWMDNKGIMKDILEKAGIPAARGATCFRFRDAEKLFARIGPPLITKPHVGSRSRHTTVHIHTPGELAEGFRKAKQLSPWVIVEEELRGMVYRGTVFGGKVVAVVRREFPSVTGNSRSTVEELVDEENRDPRRAGPVFHQIPLNQDVAAELRRQDLTLGSVPRNGEYVRLHPKMSRSFGATTSDVTDSAHPDTILLLEDIGKLVQDSVVGVDFILDDIRKSWRTQKSSGVIECNSMPFIDLHHYPYSGTSRDVAGSLWNLVFPGSVPGAA